MRYSEIYLEGAWTKEKDLSKLKKGMVFRLFEEDGSPLLGFYDKSAVFIAKSDSYVNEEGIWTIEVEY